MSKLLIEERPLQVLPSLVIELGNTDKAIILQQVHYWLQRSSNIEDGHTWVYNSVHNWQKQFPWLSEKTIQRYLSSLEKDGWLITGNYNKAKFDRTKWYRINYDKLGQYDQRMSTAVPTSTNRSPNGMSTAVLTNTIDYTETTTETNYNILSSSQANNDYDPNDPIRTISQSSYAKDIIDYLNQKTGKSYRYTTAKTRKLLNARFNEGFLIDDFKKVIDNKVAEWGNDEKMNRFLRPETLFGTKFEGYLNEQPKKEVARKKDIPDYLQRF